VNLAICPEEIGTAFKMVEPSVRAILVRKNSASGAVRVFGTSVRNVVTGPKEVGFVIVVVKSGEECMLLGSPSVRYFRLRSS
jgi:nucleoside-triphosphatase THEP1